MRGRLLVLAAVIVITACGGSDYSASDCIDAPSSAVALVEKSLWMEITLDPAQAKAIRTDKGTVVAAPINGQARAAVFAGDIATWGIDAFDEVWAIGNEAHLASTAKSFGSDEFDEAAAEQAAQCVANP